MPQREGMFVPMETLPKAERIKVDREFQAYWYAHAGQFVIGRTVLDAGAGMGYGVRLLANAGAARVEAFDLVSLVPWVRKATLDDYADASFDFVLAMDVIEHVPDDTRFLGHLLRIARLGVIFTTPNWEVFHAVNEHHYREYTPVELLTLLAGFKAQWKRARFWTGDEHCSITMHGEALPLDTRACNFFVLLEK